MDWLDAAALRSGVDRREAETARQKVLDAIWFLIWCASTERCLIVMHVYGPFLEQAVALRKSGQLKGVPLKIAVSLIDWANPNMEAWIERTGPGTPARRETMERIAEHYEGDAVWEDQSAEQRDWMQRMSVGSRP